MGMLDPVDDRDLYAILHPKDGAGVLAEVRTLTRQAWPSMDFSCVGTAFADVEALFAGDYPGYREANAPYHDAEHTRGVFLATARLLHGAWHAPGRQKLITDEDVECGLLAALFHDVGLIQEEGDLDGTGAKYTVGHEDRSAAFARDYVTRWMPGRLGMAASLGRVIEATRLSTILDEIPYASGAGRFLGAVVATADILAQMADRKYLEKLLLLYREFEEAGVAGKWGLENERQLLEQTADFHARMQQRLSRDLDDARSLMRLHFLARHGLDRDLYEESVAKNLAYLEEVLGASCDFQEKLRRGNIVLCEWRPAI